MAEQMAEQTASVKTTPVADVEILHLSRIIKSPLVDKSGDRLGKVQDVVIRLGSSSHPPVVGLVVRIGGRDLFVPIDKIAAFEPGSVRVQGKRVDMRRFERRPGELLLAQDLSARHLINLVGGRLIQANEIELAKVNDRWEVVGVDPSRRSPLKHWMPGRFGEASRHHTIVDWESIEPFVAHVPTAKLRIPYRKLKRLHPAQIADLVEAASHDEGKEIIDAVGEDSELEADVFEELDTEHQVEFIRSRTDSEAARLLATMAPDDAADLIMEVDQEARLPILNLLPFPQQRKVRALLSYNPETAGGIMIPDFLCLRGSTRVVEAIDAIRSSKAPPEAISVVFASDKEGNVTGSIPVVRLIQADPNALLDSVVDANPSHVHPDWDIGATVRKMSDFNLTVAPV